MSTLNCSFCTLASRAGLPRATGLRLDLYRSYTELDQRVGHTLSPTRRPLLEVTGVPLIAGDDFENPASLIGR